MNLRHTFEFEFVEFVPKALEPGKLYISIEYRTAVHSCFCGCGMKVVTPIRPHEWQLAYDGEAVTLSPSIGNWSFPCQSHYWLRANRVVAAGPMSRAEIDRGRAYDAALRDGVQIQAPQPVSPDAIQSVSQSPKPKAKFSLIRWLLGK